MAHPDLFAVLAQVLPTLLIAVVLELRSVAQLGVEVAVATDDLDRLNGREPEGLDSLGNLKRLGLGYAAYAVIAGLFTLGELACLSALLQPQDAASYPYSRVVACGAALALTFGATSLPFVHFLFSTQLRVLQRQLADASMNKHASPADDAAPIGRHSTRW